MIDLDKKGELEFLIDTCIEEAKGMCHRCEDLGEPSKVDGNGVLWHWVAPLHPRAVKPYWGECNASAVWRIVHFVRDRQG